MTAEKAFARWLNRVPSLADCNDDTVTIDARITLPTYAWLQIAHVAAVHGHTVEEALDVMLFDAATESDFMNDPREYHHESEGRREEERQAREAAKMAEAGKAAKKKPLEGDEWKQEGGTQ